MSTNKESALTGESVRDWTRRVHPATWDVTLRVEYDQDGQWAVEIRDLDGGEFARVGNHLDLWTVLQSAIPYVSALCDLSDCAGLIEALRNTQRTSTPGRASSTENTTRCAVRDDDSEATR